MRTTYKMAAIISMIIFILLGCNKYNDDVDKLELYILRHVEGTSDFEKDTNPIFTGKIS